MKTTNPNSNAAATVAKINLVVALGAAAIVALVFGGNSSSAGSFPPAIDASTVQRPAASIQLADPSDEEINKASFPEKHFKQLNCETDTDCEKAAAKRILSLKMQITRLQLRINKAGASIVRLNDEMQLLKAELKHLQDDSKQ